MNQTIEKNRLRVPREGNKLMEYNAMSLEQIAEALKEARSRCRGPTEQWGCDAAIVLLVYTFRKHNPAFTKVKMAEFASKCGMASWPFGLED